MTKNHLLEIVHQYGAPPKWDEAMADAIMAELETEERRRTVPNQLTHVPQMTLRDWFAGQALAKHDPSLQINCDTRAGLAYKVADAMMAERERLEWVIRSKHWYFVKFAGGGVVTSKELDQAMVFNSPEDAQKILGDYFAHVGSGEVVQKNAL